MSQGGESELFSVAKVNEERSLKHLEIKRNGHLYLDIYSRDDGKSVYVWVKGYGGRNVATKDLATVLGNVVILAGRHGEEAGGVSGGETERNVV
jgi:hypothetical protein